MIAKCVVCGKLKRVAAFGRCWACYAYERRNKRTRPFMRERAAADLEAFWVTWQGPWIAEPSTR